MKRRINICLVLLIGFIFVTLQSNPYVNAAQEPSEWIDTTTFRENSYLYLVDDLLKENNVINFNQSFSVVDQKVNNSLTYKSHSEYKSSVAVLPKNDSITFAISVPDTGLYEIALDYYLENEFSNSPLINVLINDEIQFNESESVRLDVSWESISRDESDAYDRYGNELLPYSNSINKWYTQTLKDDLNYLNAPYKFILNEGVNTITITSLTNDLLIGDLTLQNTEELISYSDYLSQQSDPNITAETLRFEAEDFTNKNNLEIKASYYKYPSLKPYSFKTNVLNILDGSSMRVGSDSVTYSFNVEKTGYYNISLKYRQAEYVGIAVMRNIYIDDVIPFAELENYIFSSNENYENHTLGGTEDYKIYLEEGEHTLTLEVTNDVYREYVIRLQQLMDGINNIGLRVNTITGGQTNAFRTWDIEKYIPTIKEDLLAYSQEALALYDELNSLNTSRDNAPDLTTLEIVSQKLKTLSDDPNDLPNKMEELNEGSGSAYQLTGNAMSALTNHDMDIDSIFVHTEDDLPRATANFFVRLWDGIRSFFYSFFDDRYKTSRSNDPEELEVWVGESSLYVNLMQQMVDDEFTEETGIKVNLRVLANNQKIILSNANDSSPDVVMGIDSWLLYDYALRGMTEDLSAYPGFNDLTGDYAQNIFTPMIFEEGVYGLPETMGNQVLIYRTDILEYLELDPPQTWDEVIEMLPILQSYQMNFYHPLGGVSSWKGYMNTAPFIYQYGGEIYADNADESSLKDEDTKAAIEFMTDLFTVYNLPKQTSSFFEHFRSGNMPIGVTDIGTYLQIKYAASELTGQWEIAPIPGNDLDNDGIIERYQPAYGKAAMMIKDSELKDEAWKFLSWWNSSENQQQYLQTIKMNLGERYMIVPANLDALENSVWNEEVKTTYLSQAEWIRTPAITPGSYIVERELSNIWNKIVIDKENARIAIDESIIRVERELTRKLTEFGYIDQYGECTYLVPRNDNIDEWIEGDKDDDE